MLDRLIADLQATANGVVDDAMIDRGAGWIRELKREFPWVHTMIMNALYGSPESVLETLAGWNKELAPLVTNENALAYVKGLQAKLRGKHADKIKAKS